MEQIPIISIGAFDTESILKINKPEKNSVLSADNIESLNNRKNRNANTASGSSTISGTNTVSGTGTASSTNTASNPSITLPTFTTPMRKGQKLVLSQTPAAKIKASLGWNVKNNACDLDVSAFLLSNTGKVPGEDWFVFYGQTDSPDGSVHFREVNDAHTCEAIEIDFHTLHPAVDKIVFVLTINEAFEKNLNFSMVKDAYIRITDCTTGKELVSYQMEDYYSNVISMMIGEIYKHNGIWKFNAVGNGVARDLAGLCELYGVEVVSS